VNRAGLARVLAFVAIAMLRFSADVWGQDNTELDTTPTTVLLDFGFSGVLPAGEWAPVRIAVSPMEEAVEAIARIRISTRDGGSITSFVPVTSTPGRETLVPTTLWIPPVMTGVVVDLISQDRGPIASTRYGTLSGAQSIQLPMPSPMPIILGVGTPSLRLAFGVENYQREFFGPGAEALRERASVARVASAVPPSVGAPPWLPSQAKAYSGVSAVVVDGQVAQRLTPASLEALREWILSGGRLVLVNADNSALQRVLGNQAPQGLSMSPPASLELPAALGGPAAVLARGIDAVSWPAGWSPLPAAPDLAAQGPVGLGWVMLLGFDPDSLAEGGRAQAVELAWHGTLGEMILGDLEDGRGRLGRTRWEDTPMRELAERMALAWVSRAPTVGIGAFATIFIMMIALAFLIGPVDRVVLKRLGKLHRWWLAALIWIGLATIGAWILPTKVRSGPTTSNTIRIVDALDTPDEPTRAWQVSVNGMFFNRPVRLDMTDLDADAWLAPMIDPWDATSIGSLSMTPRGNTMKPGPITARLWTTRAYQQSGPTAPTLRARLELDNGLYRLTLRGDGADSIRSLTVNTRGQWLHALPGGSAERRDGELRLNASIADLTGVPPDEFDPNSVWTRRYDYGNEPPRPDPGVVSVLEGPQRRAAALAALGSESDWAVVYASWTDEHPLFGSSVGEEFSTMWVYRIAIPVVSAGAASGDAR